MGLARWIKSRRWGLATGAIAIAVGAIVYSWGGLARLDRLSLDLHFRHAYRSDADDRIVQGHRLSL